MLVIVLTNARAPSGNVTWVQSTRYLTVSSECLVSKVVCCQMLSLWARGWHLRMTFSSWSLDGFVYMGVCVDTSHEYDPEASKSMFLRRICRSLLSFHCTKTTQTLCHVLLLQTLRIQCLQELWNKCQNKIALRRFWIWERGKWVWKHI
jgi:hypothetical protein